MGYDPEQPRDEGGEGGGQWVAGGGGGAAPKGKGASKSGKLKMTPELKKAAMERASKVGITGELSPKELTYFAKKVLAEGPPKAAPVKPVTPKAEGKPIAPPPDEDNFDFESARAKHGFEKASQMAQEHEGRMNQARDSAITKHGGDPKLANKVMNDWIGDAYTEGGFVMKAATAEMMGMDVKEALARSHREVAKEDPKEAAKIEKAAVKFAASTGNMKTFNAIVKSSQEMYKEDTVTLYRGIGGKQAQQIRDALAKDDSKSLNIASDVVASFTEDPAVAQRFAEGGGLVVRVSVPRSAIVMSHRFVRNSAQREKEVLVAAKKGFSVAPGDVMMESVEKKDAFDPDQPRDENGQWADGGGGSSRPSVLSPKIVEGPKGSAKVFYLSEEDRPGYPAVYRVQVDTKLTGGTNAKDFDTQEEAEKWANEKLGGQKGLKLRLPRRPGPDAAIEDVADHHVRVLSLLAQHYPKTAEFDAKARALMKDVFLIKAEHIEGLKALDDQARKEAKKLSRADFDEDQPRDEQGRWSAEGGGGAGTFKGNIYRTSKEYSRKHLPGGKTKKEHTGEWKEGDDYDTKRAQEREWDSKVARQVALGRLDPETAKEAGWNESGHVDKGHERLPERMWHVTTAADAVRKEGLKTRAELRQSDGKGLGGGPDDTISFTDSPQIAAEIEASMLEFHDLLNDRLSIKEMYERASTGADAKKPYAAEVLRSMDAKSIDDVLSPTVKHEQWNLGDAHPPKEEWYDPEAPRYSGLDGKLLPDVKGSRVPVPAEKWRKVEDMYSKGKDGQNAPMPYATVWERDRTEFERNAKKAEFFKAYSLWREHAGGRMDPLFFSTDVIGFKNVPRDQIQTLEYRPNKGYDDDGNQVNPVGYRANSLGEIRTYTGDAVKLVTDFDREDWDDQPRDEAGRFASTGAGEADLTRGSLGISREAMPQLPSGTVLEKFLKRQEGSGYTVRRNEPRKVSDLKPTQATMNMAKVESMVKNVPREILAKPVVVSDDGHILDGHHRWAALKILDPDATIQTHYVGMPIRRLLKEALNDPDSIRRTVNDSDDTMKTRLDSILENLRVRRDDLDRRIAALELTQATIRRDYDDDQPRDEGGRWTSGGGGGGADRAERALTGAGSSKPAASKSKEPSKGLKELSERVGKSYPDLDKKGMLQKRATRLEPKEHAYMKALASGKRVATDPKIEKSIASKLGVNTEHLDDVAKDYEASGTFKAVEESRAKWQGGAAGKLDTQEAFMTSDGKWAPDRITLREKYIEDTTKGRPTSDTPTLYMTGGGPASGKTSGLLKNDKAGIPDAKKAAHINADEAKEFLPEYSAGKEARDAYAASFVHEESSTIAKVGVARALKDGHDVVFDSTGDSGIDSLSKKVEQYRAQGAKRVVANYAVIDVDEAIKRSDARAEKSGRFVPHSYLRSNHADVARTLVGAIERKLFDNLDVWDTTADGKPPTHVATYTKETGLKIHNQGLYDKMVARGKSSD